MMFDACASATCCVADYLIIMIKTIHTFCYVQHNCVLEVHKGWMQGGASSDARAGHEIAEQCGRSASPAARCRTPEPDDCARMTVPARTLAIAKPTRPLQLTIYCARNPRLATLPPERPTEPLPPRNRACLLRRDSHRLAAQHSVIRRGGRPAQRLDSSSQRAEGATQRGLCRFESAQERRARASFGDRESVS